jgi:hypothetical protein
VFLSFSRIRISLSRSRDLQVCFQKSKVESAMRARFRVKWCKKFSKKEMLKLRPPRRSRFRHRNLASRRRRQVAEVRETGSDEREVVRFRERKVRRKWKFEPGSGFYKPTDPIQLDTVQTGPACSLGPSFPLCVACLLCAPPLPARFWCFFAFCTPCIYCFLCKNSQKNLNIFLDIFICFGSFLYVNSD